MKGEIGIDSELFKTIVVGLDVPSFLERPGNRKQNVREHSPLKLINVASPRGMKVFADITGTGAG